MSNFSESLLACMVGDALSFYKSFFHMSFATSKQIFPQLARFAIPTYSTQFVVSWLCAGSFGRAPSLTHYAEAAEFPRGSPGNRHCCKPHGKLERSMMAASKPSATRQITHVLFDMDGLLLDTEKFYTVVQEKILAEYGKTFDWSLKAKMMGKKALEAGQIFVQDTGLAGLLTPEEFITRREVMLHAMFPDSDLMPGAERLIRHLHAHNVPMAIATSSHRRHFELKSTKHGPLFSLMHHVITGDDPGVVNGKPAPDIFLIAANGFEDPELKLANVLVFEDAPSGVAAAHAAGMPVVMVPDPKLESSLCQEADQVLTSLNDFDYAHWGLPCMSSEK